MWDADAAFMGPRDTGPTQPPTVLRTVDEQATTFNGHYVDSDTGAGAEDGDYVEVTVVDEQTTTFNGHYADSDTGAGADHGDYMEVSDL
jgi:hypothetical protein